MVNIAILVGRLGRAPEVKYTGSGTAVANFSIAVDKSYKDSKGEWQKKTSWFDITAWAKNAENAANLLQKGTLVYVQGSGEIQEWEDKRTNDKRRKYVVNCEMFRVLKDGKAREGDSGAPRGNSPAGRDEQDQRGPEISDEDISF